MHKPDAVISYKKDATFIEQKIDVLDISISHVN